MLQQTGLLLFESVALCRSQFPQFPVLMKFTETCLSGGVETEEGSICCSLDLR